MRLVEPSPHQPSLVAKASSDDVRISVVVPASHELVTQHLIGTGDDQRTISNTQPLQSANVKTAHRKVDGEPGVVGDDGRDEPVALPGGRAVVRIGKADVGKPQGWHRGRGERRIIPGRGGSWACNINIVECTNRGQGGTAETEGREGQTCLVCRTARAQS